MLALKFSGHLSVDEIARVEDGVDGDVIVHTKTQGTHLVDKSTWDYFSSQEIKSIIPAHLGTFFLTSSGDGWDEDPVLAWGLTIYNTLKPLGHDDGDWLDDTRAILHPDGRVTLKLEIWPSKEAYFKNPKSSVPE